VSQGIITRSINNVWRSRQIPWDDLWITQAHLTSMRSRCSRDRIGVVIVSSDNQLLATGYNGAAPSDRRDTKTWCKDWCDRAKEYPKGLPAPANGYVDCPSTHAEVNALLRMQGRSQGAIMYTTALPCYGCAKFIAACRATKGLDRVVIPDTPMPGYRGPVEVEQYLRNCGVRVDLVPTP